MDWASLALLSALFLGVYHLAVKHAVRDNAVLPVLFLANVAGAAVWLVLLGLDRLGPGLPELLRVAPLDAPRHALIAAKSALVGCSWLCAYLAVKHLPLSLAAPTRATGPVWTLLGAVLLLGERPSGVEWLGIAVTLVSFLALSLAGAKEGVHFHRDGWVWLLGLGTLLGSASALYDRFLIHHAGLDAATVQAWFSIYLALFFLPLALGWRLRPGLREPFAWRGSILLLAGALLVADFLYFHALRDPDALIALVSSLRRGSVLVAFAGGLWLFGERNGWRKLPAVLGILAGITLTLLG
jgi:drug/metabolite transporter (DMT)-like permease